MKAQKLLFIILTLILTFVLASCSGKAAPTVAPTAAPTPTTAPKPTDTLAPVATATTAASATPEASAVPAKLVTSYKNIQKATIQIESQGTFIDPQVGLVVNGAGRGSGFIIDPSGIAVTANHVVTGAAILKVWVGGDTSKTYNAKVLGVSECSDLAVIQLDGQDFNYVDWYTNSIDAGMDIYIAGFPLGDPQFTLNKGIVSKVKTQPLMSQTDVESVIEVDATSNPGNSGGPIIDANGKVVAVLYAGSKNTGQSFGISSSLAKGIVDQLSTKKNLETLGINGQAVRSDDGTISGIWISSVQSGSSADKAGLKAGDIITQLEGLVLASDGTMKEYCQILRSRDAGATLSMTVFRWLDQQILEGQINGRKLEVKATTGGSDQTGGQSGDQTAGNQPNPNASKSGDVYYQADFTQPLSSWIYYRVDAQSNAIVNDNEGVTADLKNGKLLVDFINQNTYLYLVYDQFATSNVRIDAKVVNLGRNKNNVGMVCRVSDRGWYEFNIANDGTYYIYRYDVNKQEYVLIYNGGSTAIKTGQSTNVYTAVCQDNKLGLWINNKQTYVGTDNVLTEGKAGISFASFDILPITLELTDFILSVP